MKKQLLVGLSVALLAACGAHAELTFTEVVAQRLEDGQVELTAVVKCGVVGVPDCGDLTRHCIRAEWHPVESLRRQDGTQVTELPAKGNTVDMNGEYAALPSIAEFSAESCNERLLQEGETDTLRVASGAPIPTDRDFVIRLTNDSHGGMPVDLERIVVSP